jgi:hypothetical protein
MTKKIEAAVSHYQREIEELITRGADQYNKLKIELANGIPHTLSTKALLSIYGFLLF